MTRVRLPAAFNPGHPMFQIPPLGNGHYKPRLLVVADRPGDLAVLVRLLVGHGYPVVGAALAAAGETMACDYVYDLLVVAMPSDHAESFAAMVRRRRPLIRALIVDATAAFAGPPPVEPGATSDRAAHPLPASDTHIDMLTCTRVVSTSAARRWSN